MSKQSLILRSKLFRMKLVDRISHMNAALLYGLFNAVAGLLVGFYVYVNAIGDGYAMFMLTAPVAVFGVGFLLWKFTMSGEETTYGKVFVLGVLTGTISHYFTWLLTSIAMNVCFRCTGGCTDSFGNGPESILSMLGYGFFYSVFSLLFVGWMTILGAVLCGLLVRWIEKNKKPIGS